MRPIIVVGAARSGTTLLSEGVLAQHPALSYWSEPLFVWNYGTAFRQSDFRSRADATPQIKEYIRHRFADRLERDGGLRLVEKTPANCFRLPFVLEIFPDCQVIHVLRDGRDVAISAAREWVGRGTGALDYPHLRRGGEVIRVIRGIRQWSRLSERVRDLRSFIELMAYGGRLAAFIARNLFHTSHIPWGPRFPGIRKFRKEATLLETCALQWDLSVRMVRSASASLTSDQYIEVYYENLVARPREVIERILQFTGLLDDAEIASKLDRKVVDRDLPKWPEQMSTENLQRVEELISASLVELGYELGQ